MHPDTEKKNLSSLMRIAAIIPVCLTCVAPAVLPWERFQTAHGQTNSDFWVRSASFADGGTIPRQYTCDGANLSPRLAWATGPAGTRSFAIAMNDPDAPIDFTHWIVWNIGPDVRELPQGASRQGAMPAGSDEGSNSFGRLGYGGPCPPHGKPHHYVFRVYALNIRLDLPAGATTKQLGVAKNGHVLAQGQTVGTYQR